MYGSASIVLIGMRECRDVLGALGYCKYERGEFADFLKVIYEGRSVLKMLVH